MFDYIKYLFIWFKTNGLRLSVKYSPYTVSRICEAYLMSYEEYKEQKRWIGIAQSKTQINKGKIHVLVPAVHYGADRRQPELRENYIVNVWSIK